MKEEKPVVEFLQSDIEALSNPDFGVKNFNEIKPQFLELRNMIIEMIDISNNVFVPSGLINHVYGFVNMWNGFFKQIVAYNLDIDGQSQFRNRQNIIYGIQRWYDSCMTGYDVSQSNQVNNFLLTLNSIRGFNLKGIEQERIRLSEMITDFEAKKKTVDTITEELRRKSGEQTIADYSMIFQKESEDHSCFRRKSRFNFKVGAAEIWLMLGVILAGVFCFYLLTGEFNTLFVYSDSGHTSTVLVNVLTRFLIISVWVYLISFCFKQYSVNKHLSTLNRHRANTLNSFKMFIESIDPSDSVTKNALMLEVAKV